MENENVLDSNMGAAELALNSSAKEYLRQTAKWAKFLSIVGMVFSAIIIVIGFAFGTVMNTLMSMSPAYSMAGSAMPRTGMMVVGIIYAIMGAILLYPCIRLLQFASRSKAAIASNDSLTMEEGIKRLRSVFRFYGILTIIMLVFYGLVIIIALVSLLGARSM